jgi:hypothetical protein
MDVAIDEAGEHRCVAEIDDTSAPRDLDLIGGTDIYDAIVPDDDDLIAKIGAGFRIEYASGANGDTLRGRRFHVQRCGVEGGSFRASSLRVECGDQRERCEGVAYLHLKAVPSSGKAKSIYRSQRVGIRVVTFVYRFSIESKQPATKNVRNLLSLCHKNAPSRVPVLWMRQTKASLK